MASPTANKRLAREYKSILESPPAYIITHPADDNILIWHYIIDGPPDTPFEHGKYYGTLTFPPDYPYKPPAIRMHTPSGRFQVDARLCLSISDFHPNTWNPAWSVSTILTGLLSFMTSSENTTGSIQSPDLVKRSLAAKSIQWNVNDARFKKNFPDQVIIYNKIIQEKKSKKDNELINLIKKSKTNSAMKNLTTEKDYKNKENEKKVFFLKSHKAICVAVLAILYIVAAKLLD